MTDENNFELPPTEDYTEAGKYPNDIQFEETTVKAVTDGKDGWSIERADGWSFYVPKEHGVEPRVGQTARFYGRGIGHTVRGLYLDGVKVFYRTEAEDAEKHLKDTYGESVEEYLRRWDAGQMVWSISMGGFGPGYEQALQTAMIEMLRHLHANKYDMTPWHDADKAENDSEAYDAAQSRWREYWKKMEPEFDKWAFSDPVMERLGLSGAQFGAARNLAFKIHAYGPIKILNQRDDPKLKDRMIQISRNFSDPYAKTETQNGG